MWMLPFAQAVEILLFYVTMKVPRFCLFAEPFAFDCFAFAVVALLGIRVFGLKVIFGLSRCEGLAERKHDCDPAGINQPLLPLPFLAVSSLMPFLFSLQQLRAPPAQLLRSEFLGRLQLSQSRCQFRSPRCDVHVVSYRAGSGVLSWIACRFARLVTYG